MERFEKINNQEAITQFLVTFITFAVCFGLGCSALSRGSFLAAAALGILSVLLQARLFVLMHDCGHAHFVRPVWLNNLFGHLCALTYGMPFFLWQELHQRHHRHQGNLDKRGQSLDLWIMTKAEFLKSSRLKQWFYRIYHFPLFTFFLGGLLFFIVLMRWPFEKFKWKSQLNLLVMNSLWILCGLIYWQVPGSREYFIYYLLIASVNFVQAIWYFYHQHMHPKIQWYTEKEYSNQKVSLYGSTFIIFPKWVSWFSANIGYHHIHHLNPRIPCYNLVAAQDHLMAVTQASRLTDNSLFLEPIRLQWMDLFRNLDGKVWDSEQKKWLKFSDLPGSFFK